MPVPAIFLMINGAAALVFYTFFNRLVTYERIDKTIHAVKSLLPSEAPAVVKLKIPKRTFNFEEPRNVDPESRDPESRDGPLQDVFGDNEITRIIGHFDDVEKVIVIGDIEGQLHVLYNLLKELNLISYSNRELKWLDDKIVVVQCGDQIDQTRHTEAKTLDLNVLNFTDRLSRISQGRFVNIIGNHEWMNVFGDLRYVHREDLVRTKKEERKKSFNFSGQYGRILRRRHLVFRINNAIFSHAGITPEVAGSVEDGIDYWIDDTNAMLDDPLNFDQDTMSAKFSQRAWGSSSRAGHGECQDNGDAGMMWTRRYKYGCISNFEMPDSLKPLALMVTGHNKESGGEVFIKTPSATILRGDDFDVQLGGDSLIMSDTVKGKGDQTKLGYITLTTQTRDNKKIFDKAIVKYYSCEGHCDLYNE